jgi:hypothetical protein
MCVSVGGDDIPQNGESSQPHIGEEFEIIFDPTPMAWG